MGSRVGEEGGGFRLISSSETNNSQHRAEGSPFARPTLSTPIFSTPTPYPSNRRASTSISWSRKHSSSRPRSSITSSPYPSDLRHLRSQGHSGTGRLSIPLPSPQDARNTPSQNATSNQVDDNDKALSQDADAINEVIVAIDMKDNGTLGCSYYIALDEALYLLEDVAMGGQEVVETLLLHIQPTTIIISNRTSEILLNYLHRNAQGFEDRQSKRHPTNQASNGERRMLTLSGKRQSAYILRSVGRGEFRFENAIDKLLTLNLEAFGQRSIYFTSVADDPTETDDNETEDTDSRQGRMMRLATSINLDSRLTLGCTGAVLNDIQRRRMAQYLPDDPNALVAFRIKSVEMFTLSDSMFVNADTLLSLQILQPEFHPNRHMRGPEGSSSAVKENLSVYGLFHLLAVTPQGKSQLRRMFLRPSIDIDVIEERQRTIQLLLRPDNVEKLMALNKCLKKMKNMRVVIHTLQKGVDNASHNVSVSSSVWAALQRFSACVLAVLEICHSLVSGDRVVIIQKIFNVTQQRTIHQIGQMITELIDFEQSQERGRIAVQRGVDASLDEMKRNYDGMEDFLTHVATQLSRDIPEWAQPYVKNCVFFPQLGFLTVVSINPQTGTSNFEGEGMNDVWEQMFINEGEVFYKNRQMKEMDEKLGDMYCMIIDKEIEIIHGLAVTVLEHEGTVIATSEVLGELDSLLALAMAAQKYGWTMPKVTTENTIQIQAGHHPLQDLVVPTFIGNDCRLSGGLGHQRHERVQSSSSADEPEYKDPSTLILTGPNHSGKSVYLKQVALIVYLSHIGSFVPAADARIGLTDRILTRVATRESVTRQGSAFSIDLRQVAFAMNFATRRSLVLLDEFGKGTNTVDGAGLVTAVLDYFASLGPERPKVLAATHFHEIVENNFVRETAEVAFAHMDMRIDFDAPEIDDQVTYLFQLVPGHSLSSFGSRCAAMNGIDKAIVERAEALILLQVRNEDLEAACSKLSDEDTRKLEDAERVVRSFLEWEFQNPRSMGNNTKQNKPTRHGLDRVLKGE